MNIVKTSRELNKVEKYRMTQDSGIVSLKDVADETLIEVDAFLIFEDAKNDGSTAVILSILDKNGSVYSCQSATFKTSFLTIAEIMDGEDFSVIKKSGTSRANRPFIDCSLAY